MCLVKVRQEEDVVVPYRVPRERSPHRRGSVRRVSRISREEVVRDSPRPSSSYLAVPAPRPMPIPAPQPVPVFVEPAPAPSVSHRSAHYIEVSPARSSRSSVCSSSVDGSEYVVRERQYRRREHSPASSSPRYEHFRYVEPAPGDGDYDRYERYDGRRSRSRPRERSPSRGREDYYGRGSRDYGGAERVTRERITISERDRDGRQYRR